MLGEKWRLALQNQEMGTYFKSRWTDPLIRSARLDEVPKIALHIMQDGEMCGSLQKCQWYMYVLCSSIGGHNWWWIDTDTIDRYYWSCWPPIVSIHGLKIFSFWLIVSIIDHKILVKPMTIDPSVHFQPILSIHWSKSILLSSFFWIKENPVKIFFNNRLQ